MNPDAFQTLNIPLGDSGITVRHAIVAAIIALMALSIISTLWNGRRGRLTCGAPRRGEGRCRRPMRTTGNGCGIHDGGWIARDVTLGTVAAVGFSLLFWNFEDVIAWGINAVTEMTA